MSETFPTVVGALPDMSGTFPTVVGREFMKQFIQAVLILVKKISKVNKMYNSELRMWRKSHCPIFSINLWDVLL
jgi:hypothetical protein